MIHTVKFQRFDFTKHPPQREEKTVTFEFPEVTDDNIDQFESVAWDELFNLPDTGEEGRFSPWLTFHS
jgi:hypothetical protein